MTRKEKAKKDLENSIKWFKNQPEFKYFKKYIRRLEKE